MILLCISGISPTFQSKKNKKRKKGGIKGDLLYLENDIIEKTKVDIDKIEHLFYSVYRTDVMNEKENKVWKEKRN